MILDAGEPEAGPWRVMALAEVVATLLAGAARRPPIVAVDGRSASGKTTFAGRLERAVPGAVTVHTDDVAWWHSEFDWAELMIEGVLEPVRRGEAVAFRPPAWERRGRGGAITVPRDPSLLIVEGVGAGRRETAHLVDAIVWVQSDAAVCAAREAARIAAGHTDAEVSERWLRAERPFVADQRPWERAALIVSGTA
jgi:hypothetical protein